MNVTGNWRNIFDVSIYVTGNWRCMFLCQTKGRKTVDANNRSKRSMLDGSIAINYIFVLFKFGQVEWMNVSYQIGWAQIKIEITGGYTIIHNVLQPFRAYNTNTIINCGTAH